MSDDIVDAVALAHKVMTVNELREAHGFAPLPERAWPKRDASTVCVACGGRYIHYEGCADGRIEFEESEAHRVVESEGNVTTDPRKMDDNQLAYALKKMRAERELVSIWTRTGDGYPERFPTLLQVPVATTLRSLRRALVGETQHQSTMDQSLGYHVRGSKTIVRFYTSKRFARALGAYPEHDTEHRIFNGTVRGEGLIDHDGTLGTKVLIKPGDDMMDEWTIEVHTREIDNAKEIELARSREETSAWEKSLLAANRTTLPSPATPVRPDNSLPPKLREIGEWKRSMVLGGWHYWLNAWREHATNRDALYEEFTRIAPRMLAFVRGDGGFGAVPVLDVQATASAWQASVGWADHTWPSGSTLHLVLR